MRNFDIIKRKLKGWLSLRSPKTEAGIRKEYKISKRRYVVLTENELIEEAKRKAAIIKHRQDVIYSITLWGGGYNGMTSLEFRLAYNIPAIIFYGVNGHLGNRVRIDKLHPCRCLKRRQYYDRYIKLTGSLEDWYARKRCEDCQGTGKTKNSFAVLNSSDRKRMIKISRVA